MRQEDDHSKQPDSERDPGLTASVFQLVQWVPVGRWGSMDDSRSQGSRGVNCPWPEIDLQLVSIGSFLFLHLCVEAQV